MFNNQIQIKMRKLQLNLIFTLIFAFGTLAISGQVNLKRKAISQYNLRAYNLAIDNFSKYLEKNSDDLAATAYLAESYKRTNDLLSAARLYEKIVTNPKHSFYHDLQYGKVLMKLGLYDKAENHFKKMSSSNSTISKQFVNSCVFAKNILALGDKYIISQLKPNTTNDEFGPEFYNNKLIYCGFENNNIKNPSLIQKPSNTLFVHDPSTKENKEMKSELIDYHGIGPVRFSPSGKYVLYTRNGFINGTLQITGEEKDMSTYIAEVDNNGNFINETALPYNGINYSVAFACFGSDDNTIYFSSNKNSNNFDLYTAKKIDGKWGEEQALNKNINTQGNEITPYYVDNKLYFSSDFLNGLGGFDVFKTTNYKNEWSFPVNLGKGVNSQGDDLYFIKKPNFDLAYLTSNRLGSKGGYDIYSAVPAKNIENDDIAYEYIPEAVNLSTLKEDKATGFSNTSIKNVSLNSNEAQEDISLDGAKMISYNEIILSPARVYFIQLASLSKSKANGKKFRKLTKYGNIYKVQKGRITKIRLGYFVSEEEAKAVLASVRKKGFRDAFIVEDILNSNELELLESDYSFANNKKYSKPAESGNYKIKLAAYSNPLYFDVNKVKDLGVIEQWSKGKWTIFILSGYKDFEDAQKAMIKAKNRGFSTAQMVIDNNGILSTVKNY